MTILNLTYSTLRTSLQTWLTTNCRNCGANYNSIPADFKSGKTYSGKVVVPKPCRGGWGAIWPPSRYSIGVTGSFVSATDITTIMNKFDSDYFNKFSGATQKITENGLFLFLNIVARFLSNQFCFYTTPFSKNYVLAFVPSSDSASDLDQTSITPSGSETLNNDLYSETSMPPFDKRNLISNSSFYDMLTILVDNMRKNSRIKTISLGSLYVS